MPFRDNLTHLRDILECITLIDAFVSGMELPAYKADLKTKSAVERQLQILTEAAIRLGEDADLLCPDIDWKGFRGMGNILRHGYHIVDDQIVWNTVQDELPPMKEAVLKAIAQAQSPPRNEET